MTNRLEGVAKVRRVECIRIEGVGVAEDLEKTSTNIIRYNLINLNITYDIT